MTKEFPAISKGAVMKAVEALGLDPRKAYEINITPDLVYLDYWSNDFEELLHENFRIIG